MESDIASELLFDDGKLKKRGESEERRGKRVEKIVQEAR